MSNEKQQKILQMAKDICRYQPCCNDVCKPISACDALKYAERAVEAGYCKPEWISVDERLPDEGDLPIDCLFAAKVGDRVVVDWGCIGIQTDWRTKEKEYYFEILHDWDEGEGCEITHWMPLPEAPKGGGEK